MDLSALAICSVSVGFPVGAVGLDSCWDWVISGGVGEGVIVQVVRSGTATSHRHMLIWVLALAIVASVSSPTGSLDVGRSATVTA
jgi:hypothetical protein